MQRFNTDISAEARILSRSDAKVLAQVFDPESGAKKVEITVDPALPADLQIACPALLSKIKGREKEAIRLIERHESSRQPASSTRSEVYRAAISILDDVVADHPHYASARNNRAQLRRWRYGDRHTLCQSYCNQTPERTMAVWASIDDLNACISLASPNRPQGAVSPAQGRLLAQAYTQLAAIYHAAAKDMASEDVGIVGKRLEGWNQERCEEEASRLFYLGGLYGNEVAQALAVHTNPHAKLCGAIVKEAMMKEHTQI